MVICWKEGRDLSLGLAPMAMVFHNHVAMVLTHYCNIWNMVFKKSETPFILLKTIGRNLNLPIILAAVKVKQRQYVTTSDHKIVSHRGFAMIRRYARPEMDVYLKLPINLKFGLKSKPMPVLAMAKLGLIPQKKCRKYLDTRRQTLYATIYIERIETIEAETKHDVIAFLTELAEHTGMIAVGPSGPTSDIPDNSSNVHPLPASDVLLADLKQLLSVPWRSRAKQYQYTPLMGRPHVFMPNL